MTKTQIFLQNFCHGQICCPKTLESRKKPAENKQTAKAVCYLSRYSYSTVYVKIDGEIECVGSDGVIEDYADIGLMFDDLELHQYGIIVNVGDGEYKILEE